jgi:hypothetical protein
LSCEVFDPNCEGCKPAMMDSSGRKLGPDDPAMKIVNEEWGKTPRDEQEACWRIWVKNSRSPVDMVLAQSFFERVQNRLKSAE